MHVRKKAVSFLLRTVITLGILYWVLSSVPTQDYQQAALLFSIHVSLVIFALVVLQVMLLALRWYLLAKAAGSRISIPLSMIGILMSFFFSQGLPASIGGDSFRIWWHRREGINTGIALKIILFDRIYGMLSLVFLCLGSVILLSVFTAETTKTTAILLLVIIMGCFLGLFVMPLRLGVSSFIESIALRLPTPFKKALHWLVMVRDSLRQQPLSMTFSLLGIGLLTHICVVVQVYVIGHALNSNTISMMICLASIPPALLISYMPFSIAGWGVREASMVVALGLFNIPAATAILISLTIGMVIFCFSLAGGVMWMIGGFRSAYLAGENDAISEPLSLNP
ncbi:MAG: flippase-like domain-containing protein [Legionellaceae bacterium]|nr:flippase-like domain-containing protein [Legionellaceae bacterium]MBP9774376.1 flippase-like domain-containing protein [Legionellaceae bacterium]